MSEGNEAKASLSRKEIKLIRLMRIHEDFDYKEIEDNINNAFEEWKRSRFSAPSDESEADYETADWLNSDYYKK